MIDIFATPAQMDMSKSVGYRAVEELLKAQSTHTALRRQFEEARVAEMTLVQREVRGEEENAIETIMNTHFHKR